MPYVHAFKDRHGKVRHYYRRHGKRVPLPGLPGEKGFMAAYAAAAETAGAPKKTKAEEGTFHHLIAAYTASTAFKKMKPLTQRTYRQKFERFAQRFGHLPVADMEHEHVDRLIASMSDTPGAANTFLKRFKTLMKFAIVRKYTKSDPTIGVKPFKAGEFHTWTEAEIAKFEAHWALGTRQRLAFALHLYTGQRRSDVHRMAWDHVENGRIRVVQEKTGARLSIPLHPALATILEDTPRTTNTIIATGYGRPFSVAGYGNWINEAIRDAGLPAECTAHGLRKAAARRLAEVNCSSLEIMSVTGHKTLAEVERYTRAVDQERLSSSAIRRQTEADRQT